VIDNDKKPMRTGPFDATVCMIGEDMNFAVREMSLASMSQVQDMGTILLSIRCGNWAVNATATASTYGIPCDDSLFPFQILHEKYELHGV